MFRYITWVLVFFPFTTVIRTFIGCLDRPNSVSSNWNFISNSENIFSQRFLIAAIIGIKGMSMTLFLKISVLLCIYLITSPEWPRFV